MAERRSSHFNSHGCRFQMKPPSSGQLETIDWAREPASRSACPRALRGILKGSEIADGYRWICAESPRGCYRKRATMAEARVESYGPKLSVTPCYWRRAP